MKHEVWQPDYNPNDVNRTFHQTVPALVFQKRSGKWYVSLPALMTPKGPFNSAEEAEQYANAKGYKAERK